MTPEESRNFLIILHKSLWPDGHQNGVVSLEAFRKLSDDERVLLESVLKGSNFFYEMFCTNMFGGYGVRIYEHAKEPFPGAVIEPQHLLTLIENHLFDKMEEEDRLSGSGSSRGWDFFSQFTHTPEMKEFCRLYKRPLPRSRDSYDY